MGSATKVVRVDGVLHIAVFARAVPPPVVCVTRSPDYSDPPGIREGQCVPEPHFETGIANLQIFVSEHDTLSVWPAADCLIEDRVVGIEDRPLLGPYEHGSESKPPQRRI